MLNEIPFQMQSPAILPAQSRAIGWFKSASRVRPVDIYPLNVWWYLYDCTPSSHSIGKFRENVLAPLHIKYTVVDWVKYDLFNLGAFRKFSA